MLLWERIYVAAWGHVAIWRGWNLLLLPVPTLDEHSGLRKRRAERCLQHCRQNGPPEERARLKLPREVNVPAESWGSIVPRPPMIPTQTHSFYLCLPLSGPSPPKAQDWPEFSKFQPVILLQGNGLRLKRVSLKIIVAFTDCSAWQT